MKKVLIASAAILVLSTAGFAQDVAKKEAKMASKEMKHDAKVAKKEAKMENNHMKADSAKGAKHDAKMMKKDAKKM